MQVLQQLCNNALNIKSDLKSQSFVLFSDLHMGDGSRWDDFLPNSQLFSRVLSSWYLKKEYNLILNGDIEELQKFSYSGIRNQWRDVYSVFDCFYRKKAFYKTVGNHDMNLNHYKDQPYPLYDSLKLNTQWGDILVFHGHQATKLYSSYNNYIEWILRYLARPLGINNHTTALNSRRKNKIERNVYQFSSEKKIVSLIGHTHRPLFESHNRVDTLRFEIEKNLESYQFATDEEKPLMAGKIRMYKNELKHILRNKEKELLSSVVYSQEIPVPNLFNSGCVIGKRGMTCLELINGKIQLVHWFDRSRATKYFNLNGYKPEALKNTEFYRVVLRSASFESLFNRIHLLS